MLSRVAPGGDETLGARIRNARKAMGWTLEELGNKLGVSKVSVWAWEQNRCQPRAEVLRRLSSELCLSVEDLLFGGGDKRLPNLIAECRRRIAAAMGVEAEDIEIRIKDNGETQDVASRARASSAVRAAAPSQGK